MSSAKLRTFNLIVGVVHAAQAALILLLANDFAVPVKAPYLAGPPGSADALAQTELFEVRFGPVIAVFLALAAIDHLVVAAPRVNAWYEANLARRINPARWYEYAISASVMILLIALLTGITDAVALIAVFGVNAAMIGFGLRMERINPDPERVDWRPYWMGWAAGLVPWVGIVVAIATSETQAEGPPGFVYGIFVSLFVLFFSFAVNMGLQYRRVGRWADYRFGEVAYVILSLAAKSALAWQIFGGTLAD